jgi:hypothetical protein
VEDSLVTRLYMRLLNLRRASKVVIGGTAVNC